MCIQATYREREKKMREVLSKLSRVWTGRHTFPNRHAHTYAHPRLVVINERHVVTHEKLKQK